MKARVAFSAPTSAKFSLAQTKASTAFSAAKTRECGASVASARAIAPEPVPRSTAIGDGDAAASSASSAICTSVSVSGRGTNTPGPTRSSRWRNGAVPVMCCSGSRLARRATRSRKCASDASSRVSPRRAAACSSPRPTSITCASRSSASTRASAIPAAVSVSVASATDTAISRGRMSSERFWAGMSAPSLGPRDVLRHNRAPAGEARLS